MERVVDSLTLEHFEFYVGDATGIAAELVCTYGFRSLDAAAADDHRSVVLG